MSLSLTEIQDDRQLLDGRYHRSHTRSHSERFSDFLIQNTLCKKSTKTLLTVIIPSKNSINIVESTMPCWSENIPNKASTTSTNPKGIQIDKNASDEVGSSYRLRSQPVKSPIITRWNIGMNSNAKNARKLTNGMGIHRSKPLTGWWSFLNRK